MKRMIDTDAFVITSNGVEFGKDIEVDGKIHINDAEDIVDKNGQPVITGGGGGGGGGIEFRDTAPADTTKILFLMFSCTGSNGKTGTAIVPYPGTGEATICCGGGGGTFAKNFVGLYYIVGDNAEISIFDVNETCVDAQNYTGETVYSPTGPEIQVSYKYICNK